MHSSSVHWTNPHSEESPYDRPYTGKLPKRSLHSQNFSTPSHSYKYRWEASIPYNWASISKIPLEKMNLRSSRKTNLMEGLCQEQKFIRSMYRPMSRDLSPNASRFLPTADSSPRKHIVQSRTYPKTEKQEGTSVREVQNVYTVLSPQTSSSRQQAKSMRVSYSAKPNILNLSFKVYSDRLQTQEKDQSIRLHSFPHSQLRHSPARPGHVSQTTFKNQAINEYLLRFERKNRQLPAQTKEYLAGWKLTQSKSVPKMRNVSVQDSGRSTMRQGTLD